MLIFTRITHLHSIYILFMTEISKHKKINSHVRCSLFFIECRTRKEKEAQATRQFLR